jgi:hypothetical protein
MKQFLLIIFIATISMCKNQETMEHSQWSQDKLKIPFVIRQPNEIDIPKGDSTIDSWKERQSIALVEGFVLLENENQKDLNFKFYCEINIDNPKLWKLSKRLLDNINGQAYVIYNEHEEEVQYGAEKSISEIIEKLDRIESDILNNCSFSFGVVQNEDTLNEVFIDESKFIKYWGSDEEFFRKVMKEYEIFEKKEMNFVDGYPKIVYDWNFINNAAKTNEELFEYLETEL